jgi:hypothetical protein
MGLARTLFSTFHGKLLTRTPQFRKSYHPPLGYMSATVTTAPMSQLPRPSASLVIVNERNEILLVHRNPQARYFGGVHVGDIRRVHE